MVVRSIFAVLLFLDVFGTGFITSQVPDKPFLYSAAKDYEPLAWMRGAERFPSGATIWRKDSKGKQPLAPGFAASADPVVSFDGHRILFSGKFKSSDPWQIWEIPVEGGTPRRISSGDNDCIRPFYLQEDIVVYARRTAGSFAVETTEVESGKPILRLTSVAKNSLPSDVLRDGRILFEAEYPLGTGSGPELYTIYSDGSGVEAYRCDHGVARFDGREMNGGEVVFSEGHGLAKFVSAEAQQVPISLPAGEYAGEVAENALGEWLVSMRLDAKHPFRIVSWSPRTRQLSTLAADDQLNLLQPTLIAPHTVPKRHPSGLHDWQNANLLCLNAYTSKYKLLAGSVASVRLYTRDEAGTPKALGTGAVERDGSFFVQVPGDVPLQIELLDSAGKTLKREEGFFWMRRGEQRGCVGCHAGPETAPENQVPMILLKSTTPVDMTGFATHAGGGQ